MFPEPQRSNRGDRNQEGECIRKEVCESVIKELVTALTENETNGLETTTTAMVRQAKSTMEEPKVVLLDEKAATDAKFKMLIIKLITIRAVHYLNAKIGTT